MPRLSGVREMEGGITGLSRMREEGTVPSKTGSCKVSSAVALDCTLRGLVNILAEKKTYLLVKVGC